MKKVTEKDNGRTISIPAGECLFIELEGNPTTGYEWSLDSLEGESLTEVQEAGYKSEENDPEILGAGGVFSFSFMSIEPGSTKISLRNAQLWAPDDDPEFFQITVNVQ